MSTFGYATTTLGVGLAGGGLMFALHGLLQPAPAALVTGRATIPVTPLGVGLALTVGGLALAAVGCLALLARMTSSTTDRRVASRSLRGGWRR